MKKLVALLMVITISVSPLFRGLFFNLEASFFLTVLALLSLTYFMIKLSNRESLFYNKWILFFGILLIAAYCLAFTNAVNPRRNVTALLQVLEYLVISVVLYDYYHDKKEKFAFTLMFSTVLSGFINAVIGIEAITGAFRFLNDTMNNRRLGGTFQYANTAGLYFALCVIFCLTIINSLNKPVFSVLLAGISNTLLLAMLLTRSRGGYIVGFAAIIFLCIIEPRGNKLKTMGRFICSLLPAVVLLQRVFNLTASRDASTLTVLLLISFIAAILLALTYEGLLKIITKTKSKFSIPKATSYLIASLFTLVVIIVIFIFRRTIIGLIPWNILERFASLSSNDISVSIRIAFDLDAIKLLSGNWLLGYGGGGWASLYYGVQDFYYISRAVHNHYLEVFVEAGILAFISFSAIIILSVFYSIYGLIKSKEAKQKIFLAGLLSAIVGLALHSSFDFDLSFVSLALLFYSMLTCSAAFLPEYSNSSSKMHLLAAKKVPATFILVISCTALLSLNGVYTAAAYKAEKGLICKMDKKYTSAMAYYKEAHRLDPNNSEYTFELTKLYNYFADKAIDEKDENQWRNAALIMANRNMELNPYLPEHNKVLILTYLNLDMPIEALEYAKKLVELQPCHYENYEFLAKCYLEAGKYFLGNNNLEKAAELLKACLEITFPPCTERESTGTLHAYKKEALVVMGKI